MESWDIIFSNEPIVPEQYLERYVYRYELWESKKDLLEREKHRQKQSLRESSYTLKR